MRSPAIASNSLTGGAKSENYLRSLNRSFCSNITFFLYEMKEGRPLKTDFAGKQLQIQCMQLVGTSRSAGPSKQTLDRVEFLTSLKSLTKFPRWRTKRRVGLEHRFFSLLPYEIETFTAYGANLLMIASLSRFYLRKNGENIAHVH